MERDHVSADATIEDLSSLDERHVRHIFSELIQEYLALARRLQDPQLQLVALQHLQSALEAYQTFLWKDQSGELAQLSKFMAALRGEVGGRHGDTL